MKDDLWLNNAIPKQEKRKMDILFYSGPLLLVIILITVGIYILEINIIFGIVFPILMGVLAISAMWYGDKIHPIEISFREDGIHLKRPSGKIKYLKWKSVIGLKLGKYACIFTIYHPKFRTPISLYNEAKAEALYYFKKYGVKSNPKLEKVIKNIEAQSGIQNLNKYLNK